MNGILASECSSGCESGWTLYLDHSVLSPLPSLQGNEIVYSEGKMGPAKDEDEEKDLSMVSDASSGPPIFHEDYDYVNSDNGQFYHAPIEVKNRGKRKGSREDRLGRKVETHPSFLDDTASSPIVNFSQLSNNNNFTVPGNQSSMENTGLDESCSATHFEVRSGQQEPFGLFQSPLSLETNCSKTSGLEGRWS